MRGTSPVLCANPATAALIRDIHSSFSFSDGVDSSSESSGKMSLKDWCAVSDSWSTTHVVLRGYCLTEKICWRKRT